MTSRKRKREWRPSNLFYLVIIIFSVFLCLAFYYFDFENFARFQFKEPFASGYRLLYFVGHIFFWIIGVFSVFFWTSAISLWYETYHKIGIVSSEEKNLIKTLASISRMNRLNRGSRVLLFYFGLIGLIAFLVIKDWILLFSVALAISVYIWHEIRISRPPTILFLSTSNSRSINLFWHIQMLYRPLRTVALLDTEISNDEKISSDLSLDCLRTTNSDDWWAVISILFQHVPIIIIDTSAITSGVVREGEHVLSMAYEYKCIFLADSNLKYPLLDVIDSNWRQNPNLCLGTLNETIIMIDKVLNSNSCLTIDAPIKRVTLNSTG